MKMTKRKIALVTSTRADWGLLRDIAAGIRADKSSELILIATNMHLDPRFGMTVNEIEEDGFEVNARVAMQAASDSAADTARAVADCLRGMADAFERFHPDMVVLLGDRYEMLAVASAATIMRIPVVHIAGGEISEGAFDDSIRHAITKLSTLHLTATEEYRNRVISMGEDPRMVINTGAIGVYNLSHEMPMPKADLEASVGLQLDDRSLLITLHPATLDPVPTRQRIEALLEALDSFPESAKIFTYPNNDPDSRVIIERIEDYVACHKGKAVAIPSLGRRRYLSALRYVGAVVGNSSSGIVEVPSTGIPTVDIGIRQQGRLASESVIHCAADAPGIRSAIAFALSEEGKERARNAANPYCKENTLQLIVNAITATPLETLATKRFVDSRPVTAVPWEECRH